MRRITIGLFLWISVLTAGPAAACDAECQFHSGRWQLQAGNRAYALRLFQGLADKGHAGAKFELGGMYLRGNGVTRNRTKAVELFLAAARLGHERGLEFYAKYLLKGQITSCSMRSHREPTRVIFPLNSASYCPILSNIVS